MFDKIAKLLMPKEKTIEVLTDYLKHNTEDRKTIAEKDKSKIDNVFLSFGYHKKSIDKDFVERVWYYLDFYKKAS